MKVLYAIQGTGNGHISRAKDIIPILKQRGDVDVLVSGGDRNTELPFQVTYRLHGMGFVFGKNGGIDLWKTFSEMNTWAFLKEIKKLPIKQYDLILNDFEPVSAWAAKFRGIRTIGLSHQAAVLDKFSPKPKNINWFDKAFLYLYAPTRIKYGFHFQNYNDYIFTPVIRNEIRAEIPTNQNHYTVYLPAYSDQKIIAILSGFKNISWKVFSKHSKETYLINNILVTPANSDKFIKSLVSCKGVLCGAGFETPAEALFLRKKLLVVPMKTQFEQQCNAKALEEMGVTVIKNLKKKQLPIIKKWLETDIKVAVNYPNITENIIDAIFEKHVYSQDVIHSESSSINI